MRSERLKSLIETGRYEAEPGLVAEAMLRHRGVRALLASGTSLKPAGRTPRAPAPTRRAA